MSNQMPDLAKQILSHANTFFGYTTTNAALYLLSNLWTFDYVQDCINKECPSNLQINLEKLFLDSDQLVVLVISIAGVAFLSFSNQRNFSGMTLDLLSNNSNKSNLENQENADFKTKFKKFIYVCTDIIGTHTKVIGTTGSLLRIVDVFIKNPIISLTVCGILNVGCGELSQFAVLGKNHSRQIFISALASFFESFLAGSAAFAIAHFACQSSTPALATLLTWSITLYTEAISIASTDKSIIGNAISSCCNYYKKSKEKKEILLNLAKTEGTPLLKTINDDGNAIKQSLLSFFWRKCFRSNRNIDPEITIENFDRKYVV